MFPVDCVVCNSCVNDYRDHLNGCTYTPVDASYHDDCAFYTGDYCSPSVGCSHRDKSGCCVDNSECPTEMCNSLLDYINVCDAIDGLHLSGILGEQANVNLAFSCDDLSNSTRETVDCNSYSACAIDVGSSVCRCTRKAGFSCDECSADSYKVNGGMFVPLDPCVYAVEDTHAILRISGDGRERGKWRRIE